MTDHIIIQASLAHVEELARLHKSSFSAGLERPWRAKDFTAALKTESKSAYLIKIEEEFFGYILFQLVVDEAEIISFGIDPDYQRQGLASSLMSHTMEIFTTRGIRRIVLEVREDNSGAIYFYTSFGFEEIGQRKDYYKLLNGVRKCAKILSLHLK